MVRNTTLQY